MLTVKFLIIIFLKSLVYLPIHSRMASLARAVALNEDGWHERAPSSVIRITFNRFQPPEMVGCISLIISGLEEHWTDLVLSRTITKLLNTYLNRISAIIGMFLAVSVFSPHLLFLPFFENVTPNAASALSTHIPRLVFELPLPLHIATHLFRFHTHARRDYVKHITLR